MQVDIVYFINTYVNLTYPFLLQKQLSDLVECGLIRRGHLYIECCGTDSRFSGYVRDVLGAEMARTTITMHIENNHEYFGIDRVWSLNQEYAGDHSKHIILYFHSKGISHDVFSPQNRCRRDVQHLFDHVIRPWENVLGVFERHPTVDKIGYAYSSVGFIWYNFWWVRGSYCRTVERPIITNRRHYYEDWICRRVRDSSNPIFRQADRTEIDYVSTTYDLTSTNCHGLVHTAPTNNPVLLGG